MEEKVFPVTGKLRVFLGWLQNHGLLHFDSRGMGGVSQTFPFFHNYALTYAVSCWGNYTVKGSTPRYWQDRDSEFNQLPVYTTPAHPLHNPRFQLLTKMALNDFAMTPTRSEYKNRPNLSKVKCLDLYVSRKRDGYFFVVFVLDTSFVPPAVFRLGKRDTPMRAEWQEVSNPKIFFSTSPQQIIHCVNPLDVAGDFTGGQPEPMPPFLLMRDVCIANDYFLDTERGLVHVPNLVLRRLGIL
jgi:CRISPR type I-D-associated protein Csc1